MNPNNCSTCDHKRYSDGGHCYMFREEPTSTCGQHTGHKVTAAGLIGHSFYTPTCLVDDDMQDDMDRPY